MAPEVLAAFTADGVLVRERLLDLGVAPSEIRRMLRTGELVRVRRGAYTTAPIWRGADGEVGQERLKARAAILQMRRGWVLSHDSAAHEHGLAILRPEPPYVHVTRPGFTNAWTEYGVKHHLARFAADQVVTVNGLPALDLARTAVDIARERGRRDGLVSLEGVLRRGVTRQQLQRAVEPMQHWPGSRAARWAVATADAGAESVNESLARELVLEAGIGVPETQFPVRTSGGVRWCDLRVGNLVIEAHGRVKYLTPDEGGVADRPANEVVFDERKRERLVKDRGLGLTPVYWEDYWGERRRLAIRRLRADHADACARYGARLDPVLAREAEAIRREHGDRRPGA